MKTLSVRIIALFLVLSFIGCHTDNASYSKDIVPKTNEFKSSDGLNNNVFKEVLSTPQNLKLIKSAKTRYKVSDVKEATIRIKKYARQYQGYISELQFQNNIYTIENRFTIRIPQKNFDTMMDSINNSVEFVDYENITTKDVTEEFIDIDSRLKTKLEVKKRYQKILREKAKTVKEILETEDKLRVLQEEVEVAQGKLKYLNNRVTYSTIQIELYEEVDYKKQPRVYNKTFWSKTKEGLSNGWDIVSNAVLVIINIWPLVILLSIVILVIRKRRKIAK